MPRPEKAAVVEDIKARFEASEGVLLTEYRGIDVGEMQRLRRELKNAGAELKIMKNTLARRAVADLELEGLEAYFQGPIAVAFYEKDPVPPAKILKEFAKDNESLVITGGLLSGQVLDAAAARALADLESRDVLLSRVAAALSAPISKLAGAASSLLRNAGYAFGSYLEMRQNEEPEQAQTAGDAADGPEASEADDGVAEVSAGDRSQVSEKEESESRQEE